MNISVVCLIPIISARVLFIGVQTLYDIFEPFFINQFDLKLDKLCIQKYNFLKLVWMSIAFPIFVLYESYYHLNQKVLIDTISKCLLIQGVLKKVILIISRWDLFMTLKFWKSFI